MDYGSREDDCDALCDMWGKRVQAVCLISKQTLIRMADSVSRQPMMALSLENVAIKSFYICCVIVTNANIG